MATPTRTQAVSTPKSYLTPNKVNASPRPGTSGNNASRNLAYKSPAVKTPASLQGHGHHVSVSSQPSSTPLGTNTIHDDLLAMNSPAVALIASMGSTGMTPLANGADGLGITGNGQGATPRATAVSANPEMERLQRIQTVASTLKSRVAGRGLTREGVERIAQVHGFSTLLDEDNLSIAGKATVDLEVVFDTVDRDLIREVNLKLIKNDAPEAQFQEQGTQVLKDNLQPFTIVDGIAQWTDLRDYESNLDYLRQLDCIQGGIDAVDSLYDAFQKIWNVEKDRLKSVNVRQRLRRSALGRPYMDRTPRLGLAIDYWNRRPDSQPTSEDDNDDTPPGDGIYSANISCEQGKPYTLPLNNWVSESVLTQAAPQSENQPEEEVKVEPDWQASADEAEYLSLVEKADAVDPAGDQKTDAPPNILKMHFISNLVPEVYLPLNVAESIVELGMFEMNPEMTVTYQKALQDHFNTTKARGSQSTSEERWPRCLPITSKDEPSRYRHHSYALHSVQPGAVLWCYPVTRLKFIHPRQLAGAVPILRQYALVWSLLRSLVEYGDAEPNTESSAVATDRPTQKVTAARPPRTSRKSNAKAAKGRLDDFFGVDGPERQDGVVPVDVSLDTVSESPKAKLDIYVPLLGAFAGKRLSPFLFISLHVCPDGIIEVKDLNGLQGGEDSDNLKLRNMVSRIATMTEDIGLLVEWLLMKARG